jgi:hypothetical protein
VRRPEGGIGSTGDQSHEDCARCRRRCGLAFGFCRTTPALAWDVIGAREVTDRYDVDAINLPGNRMFRQVKVCVDRNPVHFYDFDIFFRNGGHQDVRVRARINPGECTRDIDLNGGRRNIDRIVFKYEETSRFLGRATVRVLAR